MAEYPVPVTNALLQEITQQIVDGFDPEKGILFGSFASDTPHTDSDIDLLVIMEAHGSAIQRAVEPKRACRPRFVPMDLLVKTPEEVDSRLRHGSFFLRQILEQVGCSWPSCGPKAIAIPVNLASGSKKAGSSFE